ncbi:MAG: diacylglycerol kinase [Candidatus Uhrbacteria bacterium]|nr:diacylglycerol kinase [Candidatus Uhrbacteria bacterium]
MTSLLRSFRNALRGIATTFRTERSFRIQIAVGVVALALLSMLPLAAWERAIIVLVVTLVLVLELVNSSLERLVDLAKPRLHAYAGEIKDVMAGGVLVASVGAVILGLIILGPHVITILLRV